ncbi:MAG: hypothetical protein LBE52_16190 [Providencia sp.]|jgi:hypothetical protein|nr:hypothetical protein [Providencia sp.]
MHLLLLIILIVTILGVILLSPQHLGVFSFFLIIFEIIIIRFKKVILYFEENKKIHLYFCVFFLFLQIILSYYCYINITEWVHSYSISEGNDAIYSLGALFSIIFFIISLGFYMYGNLYNDDELSKIEFCSALLFNIFCVFMYADFVVSIDPNRKALTSLFSIVMGAGAGSFVTAVAIRFKLVKAFDFSVACYMFLNKEIVSYLNSKIIENNYLVIFLLSMSSNDEKFSSKSINKIKQELWLFVILFSLCIIAAFLYFNHDSLSNIELVILFLGGTLSAVLFNYLNLINHDN